MARVPRAAVKAREAGVVSPEARDRRAFDADLECPETSCELLVGHEGPHLTIVDMAGLEDEDPRQIWQRWERGEPPALFRVFPCDEWDAWPAATGEAKAEPCVLPAGHPGPHRAGRGWWWSDGDAGWATDS